MRESERVAVATLGGGCFRCTGAVFREVGGLRSVIFYHDEEQRALAGSVVAAFCRLVIQPKIAKYRKFLAPPRSGAV